MNTTFLKAIRLVLAHEGGYVFDPRDAGGETKYGISKRSYPALDIRNLTIEKATDIYLNDFWMPNHFGTIEDEMLAIKAFDVGVNVGAKRAISLLQRAINSIGFTIGTDGVIGNETIERLRVIPASLAMALFLGSVHAYYLSLNKTEFTKGWINRLFNFQEVLDE